MDWQRLFTPSAWMQRGRTCKLYDKALHDALDAGVKPIRVNEYTAKIGDVVIWVGNYPYSYGHPYETVASNSPLPKMGTRKRIYRLLSESYADEFKGAAVNPAGTK